MPIVVEHTPSATAVLGTAREIGRGRARLREQQRRDALRAQEFARSLQGRQLDIRETGQEQQFALGRGRLALGQRELTSREQEAELSRQFEDEQRDVGFERQLEFQERAAEFADEASIRRGQVSQLLAQDEFRRRQEMLEGPRREAEQRLLSQQQAILADLRAGNISQEQADQALSIAQEQFNQFEGLFPEGRGEEPSLDDQIKQMTDADGNVWATDPRTGELNLVRDTQAAMLKQQNVNREMDAKESQLRQEQIAKAYDQAGKIVSGFIGKPGQTLDIDSIARKILSNQDALLSGEELAQPRSEEEASQLTQDLVDSPKIQALTQALSEGPIAEIRKLTEDVAGALPGRRAASPFETFTKALDTTDPAVRKTMQNVVDSVLNNDVVFTVLQTKPDDFELVVAQVLTSAGLDLNTPAGQLLFEQILDQAGQ